ncbi:MAG: hypothetical protein EXS36_06315 [Pedosphaera sp.]|nr:hypothetical protein [Pedosphaera sp.]
MKTILIVWGMLLLGMTARAGTLIQFRTLVGDVQVELYDQEKPATVQNFLQYLDTGLYQDMFMHRLIERTYLQGGGFSFRGRSTGTASAVAIPVFPPVTNEFRVGPKLSNVAGTLAMGKLSYATNAVVEYATNIIGSVTNVTAIRTNLFVSGGPDSAQSQFFFNLSDNHSAIDPQTGQDFGLDFQNGGFTIFGRVVAGTGVLDYIGSFVKFAGDRNPTNRIVTLAGFHPAWTDVPMYVSPTKIEELLRGLVFMDITRHNVQVSTVFATQRQISWNTVNGLTNRVEFTKVFPPVWQTLYAQIPATNITTAMVVDPSPEANQRFYRVRVTY